MVQCGYTASLNGGFYLDPFEQLKRYHEYEMSGGDSKKPTRRGSGGDGSGCVTLLISGVILYFILSAIGSR